MTGPAQTPVVFLKAGGSAFFSVACQQALIAAQLNPDGFGSYDHVRGRTNAARDRIDRWDAMTPAEQAANPQRQPTTNDRFLAQCTASHLIRDGEYRSRAPRGDPCATCVDGYTEGQAPCFPAQNSDAARPSVEQVIGAEERRQNERMLADNQAAIAAAQGRRGGPAPPGATDYPAERHARDEDARTSVAVNAHRQRYPHVTGVVPAGSGVGGAPQTEAEYAQAARGIGAQPPARPKVRRDLVVDGETAEECINNWRKRAVEAMKTEGLAEEIRATEAAGRNQRSINRQADRAAREANRRERERDAAVRRGAPPDEVARLTARHNLAQRASNEAERRRERANDAPARLTCLRAQQARLQQQPGAGPVRTTGRAVL